MTNSRAWKLMTRMIPNPVKPILSEIYKEYQLLAKGSRNPMTTEQHIIEDFKHQLEDGDVFYDIGAFYGEYSFQACMNGAKSVIAFEPHPEMNVEFKHRLEGYRNSLICSCNIDSIQMRRLALSDENGTSKITDSFDNNICPGLVEENNSDHSTVEVQTMKGDDFINQNDVPIPDVIKIDVEGAEMRVLKGLEKTLTGTNNIIIYLEVHPVGSGETDLGTFGDNKDSLFELLDEYGYEIDNTFIQEDERINLRLIN